jgi:hypothetical protein
MRRGLNARLSRLSGSKHSLTQPITACGCRPDGRILAPWTPNRARLSTALSARRPSAPGPRARKPTASPAIPGTCVCSADRRNPRRRSATRAQCRLSLISRCDASAARHPSDRALDVVRRPKSTSIHELERYMRCEDCSELRRYPYKRSHLVALRTTGISADHPPATWWPGER